MTIPEQTRFNNEIGDGASKTFNYGFKIFEEAQLDVTITDPNTGITSPDNPVAVTGIGEENGGTFTLNSAPLSGFIVTPSSKMLYRQDEPIGGAAEVYPPMFELAIDKAVALVQQIRDKLGVTLSVPFSDGAIAPLPAKSVRANKALGFDGDGNPIVSTDDLAAMEGSGAAAQQSASEAAASETNALSHANAALSHRNDAEGFRNDAQAAVAGISNELVEEVSNVDSPIAPVNNTFYNVSTAGGPVVFVLPSINVEGEPFRILIKKKTGDANAITLQRNGSDTIDGVAVDYVIDTKTSVSIRADDLAGVDNWITNDLGAQLANPFQDELVAGVDFTAGTSTSVTASNPIQNIETLTVAMNGIVLKPSDIASVAGATINLAAPVPAGVDTIVIRHIETVEIGTPADNTVTLTKLAPGTAGNLITYDANGDPTHVSAGTAGQVLTSNGAGAAPTFQGGGGLVQVVYSQDASVATGTTIIPVDDTIPQNTEGDEYLSVSITPTNASNVLLVDVLANVTHSNAQRFVCALFQDNNADALAATYQIQSSAGDETQLSLHHTIPAGTTTETTFKVRIGGSNAGTTTFNGVNGVRRFGGVMTSYIRVTEVAA